VAILGGKPAYSLHAICRPVGVPNFLLMPMTIPMYIIQGKHDVVLILEHFSDVRHIDLAEKHRPNLKSSWYGDSIGHYEGDELGWTPSASTKKPPSMSSRHRIRSGCTSSSVSILRMGAGAGGKCAGRRSRRLHRAMGCHSALPAIRSSREPQRGRLNRITRDTRRRTTDGNNLRREPRFPDGPRPSRTPIADA
jgi:hypothetical protein